MSVEFCFFSAKISRVVIYLRIFFKNHCSKMCNFTFIELKTKSYTHMTIIHVKYSREFFGNFHMTRSLGIMLEV